MARETPRERRQIGSDKRSNPMSAIPVGLTDRKIAIARLAIVVTVVGWIGYLGVWIFTELVQGAAATTRSKLEALSYLFIVSLLTYSSLAYLTSRLGFFYRGKDHQRTPKAVLDEYFDKKTPPVTVIIPSYREEIRVVRTTILSAALQEYPDMDIVLLIDDPPTPSDPKNRFLLDSARRLPDDINRLFEYPSALFNKALSEFEYNVEHGHSISESDLILLANYYEQAVEWLTIQMEEMVIVDHTDTFLSNQVFRALAQDLQQTARAIRVASRELGSINVDRVRQLYKRLTNIFTVRVSSFERKLYVSLSNEPNKAMNLNSYIGLMGGHYREIETLSGRILEKTEEFDEGTIFIRNPEYVLTLDADSVLLPEYVMRLVYLMEQSQHARVGVAQTPYSAYPGSATRLERIAGASTDLQHIVHQGLTHYDATFWVGANAVLRKRALDEIVKVDYDGDYEIKRYIQDRTAIEDTESSIDLVIGGWKLLNYPERLSYSATPPDFGSLCIQRRRWADGGLIIVPKLRKLRKARKQRSEQGRLGEFLLRFNYMASITWSSVSLVVLLFYPYANKLVSPLLGLLALPYFLAMASDLKYCGYKRIDVLRIYGFNLVLLPVNIAGTVNSLVQVLTGSKGVFGRTPKVRKRTVAPLLFVVTPYLVLGLSLFTLVRDYQHHFWYNAVYASINSLLATYAIFAYIGLRNSIADIFVQVKPWFAKKEKKPSSGSASSGASSPHVSTDWEAILHFGYSDAVDKGKASVERSKTNYKSADSYVLAESSSPAIGASSSALTAPSSLEFTTLFQPIFDLATGEVVGHEALSRFNDGASTLRRLESFSVKQAVEMERDMIIAAIAASHNLPRETWLAINASRHLVTNDRGLMALVAASSLSIVVELKAGEATDEGFASSVLEALPPGMSLAIDDASPELGSLNFVAAVRPRYVKLDSEWVRGIDKNRTVQVLVGTLVNLADESDATVIAEGIESEAEFETLMNLGVRLGQGFLLGEPVPVGRI
jgi:EAL domain-containing protein (putative c-di-GMP-specific phosphodiesterase class I)/cellulose synthase/poly-beta-1,6-N-acetylglucosamine synthase-like glycosyltransferase